MSSGALLSSDFAHNVQLAYPAKPMEHRVCGEGLRVRSWPMSSSAATRALPTERTRFVAEEKNSGVEVVGKVRRVLTPEICPPYEPVIPVQLYPPGRKTGQAQYLVLSAKDVYHRRRSVGITHDRAHQHPGFFALGRARWLFRHVALNSKVRATPR